MIGHLPALLEQMIGNFGWLDTPAPTLVTWMWTTAAAATIAIGLTHGGTRMRATSGALAIWILTILVLAEEQAYRLSGQLWTQGRHIEPLALGLVLLPVFAPTQPLAPLGKHLRTIALAAAALIATSQAHTLRRYTIGLDNYSLLAVLTHPRWQPPVGVPTALALVIAANVLVAAAWHRAIQHTSPPIVGRNVGWSVG